MLVPKSEAARGGGPRRKRGGPQARAAVPELLHQPAQLDNRQLQLRPFMGVGEDALGLIISHHSAEAAPANAVCPGAPGAGGHASLRLRRGARCPGDRTRGKGWGFRWPLPALPHPSPCGPSQVAGFERTPKRVQFHFFNNNS